MCKKALKIFFSFLSFACTAFVCHKLTDGFCVNSLLQTSLIEKNFSSSNHDLANFYKADLFIDQPFSYLGSGGSCYAFENADSTLVIKFLKKHRFFKTKFFEGYPNLSWFFLSSKAQKGKQDKFKRIQKSCKIAANSLKEECGVIAIHSQSDSAFTKKLHIVDKLGNRHLIEGSDHFFILQKKAVLAKPYIQALILSGKQQEAIDAIEKIFDLFKTIESKGFRLLDPRIETNIGFYQGSPILIDTGCLVVASDNAHERNRLKGKYRALKSFNAFLQSYDKTCSQAFESAYTQFMNDSNS